MVELQSTHVYRNNVSFQKTPVPTTGCTNSLELTINIRDIEACNFSAGNKKKTSPLLYCYNKKLQHKALPYSGRISTYLGWWS